MCSWAGPASVDKQHGHRWLLLIVHGEMKYLLELRAERALASIEGLAVDSGYMADLDGEIEATTRAYVGPPSPRWRRSCAELSGPQVG